MTRNAGAYPRVIGNPQNACNLNKGGLGRTRRITVAGRKRKYNTAAALERSVNAYFAAISYETPAVVSTPTGEVDEDGRVKWKTVLLKEKTKNTGVGGKPVTVTKWLKPPSMAGLMLHLGVSKETWSNYGRMDGYRDVVERARARMEDYWAARLDGKGAQGAKFALSCCYGWREGGAEREDDLEAREDDPITKSLKEAADALAKANQDSPVAIHGEEGADL